MNEKNKQLHEQLVNQMETLITDGKKVDEYGNLIEGFLEVGEILKNDKDGAYVKYIEELRLEEQKRLKALEAKDQTKLTEQEKKNMESYLVSNLDSEDYLYVNAFNQEKSKSFIADNKDLTDDWFKSLRESFKSNEKSLREEYPENQPNDVKLDDSAYRTGSILKTFTDTMKDTVNDSKVKASLDVAKFMINPVGFFASKGISKVIGAALRTETGQALATSLKEKWEDVNNKKSLKSKKGLVALATIGAVAAVATTLHVTGMVDMTDVAEVAMESLNPESATNIQNTSIADNAKAFIDASQSTSTEMVAGIETPEVDVQLDAPSANVDGQELTAEQQRALHNQEQAEQRMSGQTQEQSGSTMSTQTDAPTEVEAPVEAQPTELVIESGDRLESLAKGLLPEDASYDEVKELTMKIAEFNGIEDADLLQVGQTLELPTGEELEGIQLKEFKVDSVEDLNSLEKLPYGSEITPEELKGQIEAALTEAYPDDEIRVTEYMAHVNANLDKLPQGQPIDSKVDLNLGDSHKELLVERDYQLSDERMLEEDSPYDWDAINELKAETKPDPKDTPSWNNRVSGRPGNTMGSK